MNIFFEIETGVGSVGGGIEQIAPVENNTDNTGAEPDQGKEPILKTEEFDVVNMDFDKDPNFDKNVYASLKEIGVNIDHPSFQTEVANLEKLGITDKNAQMKVLTAMRESYIKQQEMLKPENIRKNLNEMLTPEEKSNYSAVMSKIKTAYENAGYGKEAQIMTKHIAAYPLMYKALHALYKGGFGAFSTPTPSAGAIQHGAGLSYEQATNEYTKEAAKARQEGRAYDQKKLMMSILAKTASKDKARVKDYFNL